MRLVITGATGFVGRALTRTLITGGHEVTALSRDPVAAAAHLPARCRIERWHPSAGVLVCAELREAEAVVHLAGEPIAAGRWSARRKDAIRDSRVGGTRALVGALAALPGSQRPRVLISASAIGIYGDRGCDRADQRRRPGAGDQCDADPSAR
jgi:NAD dependent epimerase/dehydratase family enzyme